MIDISFLRQFSALIQAAEQIRGKSIREIQALTGVPSSSKSKSYLAILTYLRQNLPMEGLSFLQSYADLSLKTIHLGEEGRPKESMSFSSFDFLRLSQESWDSSPIREDFSQNFWFFVTFSNKEPIILTHFFYRLPKEDLLAVRDLYEGFRRKLLEGDVYSEKGFVPCFRIEGRQVAHIRPHARNKDDVLSLPVPDKRTGRTTATKQAFWLDKEYLARIVLENLSPTEKEVFQS